jgi:hypothetical protein
MTSLAQPEKEMYLRRRMRKKGSIKEKHSVGVCKLLILQRLSVLSVKCL